MRVLFVTQWFDPEPGAIRGLPLAKALVARGHQVQVLTGFPNYPGGVLYKGYSLKAWQRENLNGVRLLRVPLYPSHDGRALHRVLNYASFALSSLTLGAVLSDTPDVVYVYHPPPTVAPLAVLLKILRGIPFVYHIADLWPDSVIQSGMIRGDSLRRWAERGISWWCNTVYRQAAEISVLSPGFKQILIDRGVPARKIHVIYNWTDEDVFKPLTRDPKLGADLGLQGRFNILYAGNLGPLQGLETVIRAALLLGDLPDIQFVMAGTGPAEESLKALAASLGASNVKFIGRRQYWEMPALNAWADALLVHLKDLPFFAATIPSKTQVSLASGRPVIMAVRGDSAEIVRRAGAGLTCRPENPEEMAAAVRQLRSLSEGERAQMGESGRRYYQTAMSLEQGATETEAVLQQAAGRHRNGSVPLPRPR